jgi:signal transduction histidine kinase
LTLVHRFTDRSGDAVVLIIDDDPEVRNVVSATLRNAGLKTAEAVNGRAAVDWLDANPSPNLVLLDLMMPEMDGIEACRRIVEARREQETPSVILMLTARENKEDMTRGLEAGADDFVGKSSDQAVLRGRIRALLRRKFFQEENQRILEELKNKQLEAISARAETEAALARAADERRQHAESVAVELRQAKADLEQSNAELLRSNDELRQFAFIASHDLQEPLRSVTSFCNLLKEDYEGRLDEQADTFIDRIVNGAKRMKALITDLLAYSRVECNQSVPFHDVDLADVLDDVLANLQTTITETSAEVSSDRLPVIRGDRVQLVQLLQNLIGNAIMYRSEQPPRIEISANRRDDSWEISVQDNGIGIAPEHHQQIFDIFRRLHSRDKYPGTGIGLAACKKIVQRLGGQISVDSILSSGSTFRFTIPAVS